MKTILLSQGLFALIDDEDYDKLSKFSWHVSNKDYARRNVNTGSREGRSTVYMAREIVDVPVGLQIDHKNGNKLNNQKDNFRFVNNGTNCQNRKQNNNSTGYIGVVLHKASGKYVAQIGYQKKRIHLGSFSTKEEAAKAYDEAATRFFGLGALTNEKVPTHHGAKRSELLASL